MNRILNWLASWAGTLRAAEYGPGVLNPYLLEGAEASYQASKLRYEHCRSRGDKRGEGEAWRAMNRSLNKVLAHSATQERRSIPTEGREGSVVAW